jgi:glycine/D-amino acid oxidase-like deaminating enzyme
VNLPTGCLWWDTLGTGGTGDALEIPVKQRPALDGDTYADVIIVGAGYTGLWTAHYLREADPHLRIAVVESEVAGFGASGRNGGWCSALFATSYSKIAAESGDAAARRMQAEMIATVDEVNDAATGLGIDFHYAKGGTVTLARSHAQLERAKEGLEAARRVGATEEDLRLLGPDEARRELNATEVHGALVTPHCAAIHPARLTRGLADSVEERSVTIFESTKALEIAPHRVVTDRGTVRAEIVVRATEGFTARIRNTRRAVAPVYSLMVATEPIKPELWEEIGLARRQTFADLRHLIIYGQRTADDRIAFGGRGAPYHFGSAVDPSFDHDGAVHEAIRKTLLELFPVLSSVKFTHAWGGPLGITRDWHPSVGLERTTGLAWAGGYAGDGVATTNLAGRTLRDLILQNDSDIVRLPWVGHRPRNWEPEPLRWIGVNAGLRLGAMADRAEEKTGRPSRSGALLERLTGA